ncbi:hypothetical protein OZX74_04035 [Bifidobacterium sp. ESL0798]|uniref:hypothetical protein n=1 Tax=Bifidobacterium sp. ESL0798 TaxID=2983235 RepID=UPI0023FA2F4D|nr:hypothetical protein [Bifidobacterium sp. ESL0798]WEV74695.1 hypothetical protein OZX74_04035 [Bifidobacterium sp. ESL0798]
MEGVSFSLGQHTDWDISSLRKVAFTSEQMYTMIGGPDYLRYVVPAKDVPFASYAGDDVFAWMRRRLVDSCSAMGLVDADGVPCSALQQLIEPIRDTAFAVGDGVMPPDDDHEDIRTYVAYFGTRFATLCRFSTVPYQLGYNLIGLGRPDQWENNFLDETGVLKGFKQASLNLKATVDDSREKALLNGALDGSSYDAKKFAEAKGLPKEPFVNLARDIRTRKYRRLTIQGVDYRRTRLAESSQLRDLRIGPQPWRASEVFPGAGAFFVIDFDAKPGVDASVWEGESTSHVSIEFAKKGSLLERFSGIPRAQWGQSSLAATKE